ncbi:MAG TPA: hypothetical protein VF838_10165 [Trebonia sp.]
MRHKAIFITGFAVGFMAGARAGRGTYDKIVGYAQQVAAHPKVQRVAGSAQSKATELAKTAAAKAPGYAKNAASSAGSMASTAAKTAQGQASQVPGFVSNARQAVSSKVPARFGGAKGADPTGPGTATENLDDVDQDGNLVFPAEGSPSVNGIRRHYTPDTPDTPA